MPLWLPNHCGPGSIVPSPCIKIYRYHVSEIHGPIADNSGANPLEFFALHMPCCSQDIGQRKRFIFAPQAPASSSGLYSPAGLLSTAGASVAVSPAVFAGSVTDFSASFSPSTEVPIFFSSAASG